jgi:thiamine pyrophosphate-dependent acetolactate synthase large subunit-like protein
MNPGMLMVERQLELPNVAHFLVSNRCYGSTGQLALPNAASNDYPAIARAMGLERVYRFDTLAALEAGFDEAVDGQGPTFIVLELEPLAEKHPAAPVDGAEQKFRFGRYVEKTCGVRVFDY